MGQIRYNAAKSNFELYDAGTYVLEITAVKQDTAKSSGNPQLVVDFKFVGGRYDGKPIRGWYALTEKSGWRVDMLVDAAGVERQEVGQDANGEPIYSFEEQELVGAVIQAEISVEEYQGKKTNRLGKEAPCDEQTDMPTQAQTNVAQSAPAQSAPPATQAPAQPEGGEPAPARNFSRPRRTVGA